MSPDTISDSNLGLSWLRRRSGELVAQARFLSDDGFVFYYPVAGGTYPWFYLRDFTYMYAAAPELFPQEQVRPVVDLILRNLRADGWVPERITHEGEPIYRCHGERDVLDSGPFLIKLADAYVRATGDESLIEQHLESFCQAVAILPTDAESGLIWVDPAHPGTAYGFTDQIAKTGRELFCSLLLLQALEIIERWARQLNREERREWCAQASSKIRRNLASLWDGASGMFFAASHDCRQIDIWGSLYACHLNAATTEQRQCIVHWLAENRQRYEYLGHLRHLPEPDFWQRIIPPWDRQLKPGQFQNGAFWSTPSGWYAELLESTTNGAGIAFLCSLVETFQNIGVWECIGRDGLRHNADNLSSVLLPYGSFRKLAEAQTAARCREE